MAEIRNDNEFCIFPDGVSYLEINDLYVVKEYRSHGIGKELLNCCEKIARENGIEYIFLLSATKDAEAVRKFYTNNGFTIWTTNFFKKLK